MSFFSSSAKQVMLQALTADRVQVHSGNPGADGQLVPTSPLTVATFAAASGGVRALSEDCNITGTDPNASTAWFSVWDNNGGSPVFIGAGEITSGDVTANAAGEYTLTTGTELQLNDPA